MELLSALGGLAFFFNHEIEYTQDTIAVFHNKLLRCLRSCKYLGNLKSMIHYEINVRISNAKICFGEP